jgi:iron complex transport system permease protein
MAAKPLTAASAGDVALPKPLPRPRPWLEAALCALALTAIAAAVTFGPVAIPWRTIVAVVAHRLGVPIERTWTDAVATIVLDLRLPRALLGALVGASLAGAGTVLQGMLRNPLADPFVIGVSAGAALGATSALALGAGALGAGAPGVGVVALPALAFAGAIAATLLVYGLARRGADAPIEDLLLAGVAVSAFFGAAVSAIQVLSGASAQRVLFWLMGGLSGAGWAQVAVTAPLVAAGLLIAWLYARDLNALLLGDETAQSMGINVAAARRVLIASSAVMAAAAVAVSGLIGFVGLIVPHTVRLAIGPDHRRLIPAAAAGGAVLLVFADVGARLGPSGTELPVGIITAALGAPFFLFVLRRLRGRFWT